ncbi:MAG: reverse transcriptase N-terminal domain-containing protein, partial [Deltaproteobacteria bacterium]|nr:reverse transcriptase N-terminal domain-containing protein [Deltaproteobacteria bacterium]
MGKQMTASAGALINNATIWQGIDWDLARSEVRRLQMRIAKAVQEKRWNKACALQHLLTSSFYAKALAVKRVTSNKGKKTPGVDGVLWKNTRVKGQAI